MPFIETVPPEAASGELAEMYEAERAALGGVAHFAEVFSARPAVYAAWKALNGAVKAGMDLRRYELATLAAARTLRSSYCALAHGSILAERFVGPEAVQAIAAGGPAEGLDEADAAVIELAAKVAGDATAVTQADVDRLRDLGLSDADVLDVVLAAAVRCFFSSVLDAVGAEPDAKYRELDPGLRDALTVGRPLPAD